MPWTKWGKRRALAKIDLTAAWKALCRQPGWDQIRAGRAETAYREYLSKYIERPDGIFAPAPDVEAFWQAHMADDEKYAADCEAVFGRKIPHVDPLVSPAWRSGVIRQAMAPSPSTGAPTRTTPAPRPYPPEPRAPESPPPADDGTNMLLATVAAVTLLNDDPSPSGPPAEIPSHDAGGSSHGGGYGHDSGSYGGHSYGGDSGGHSHDSGGGYSHDSGGGSYDSGGGFDSGGGSSCGGGGGD